MTRKQLPREQASGGAGSNRQADVNLLLVNQARQYGLTTDYSTVNPMDSLRGAWTRDELYVDLDELGWFGLGTPDDHLEKWTVERRTAEYLAAILAYERVESYMCEHPTEDIADLRKLKIELPVLSTDADLDTMRVISRNQIAMPPGDLSSIDYSAITENDLRIAPAAPSNEARIKTLSQVEKLVVSDETMQSIAAIVETGAASLNDTPGRKQVRVRLSPPLMPLSSPPTSSLRGASMGDVGFTSTPENLFAVEAANIEKQLAQIDQSPTGHANSISGSEEVSKYIGTSDFPTWRDIDTPTPSRNKVLSEAKMETPLIPIDDESTPAPLDMPYDMASLPNAVHGLMSSCGPVIEQELSDSLDRIANAGVKSLAKQMEEEQLIEADTTMRVQVPNIEDMEVTVPWPTQHMASLQHPGLTLDQARNLLNADEMGCGGIADLENTMNWAPFPSKLGRLAPEDLGEDGSLDRYEQLFKAGQAVDLETLLSKTNRLRILDDHESDMDYLEERQLEDYAGQERVDPTHVSPTGQPPNTTKAPVRLDARPIERGRLDMQTLLRKRKLELDNTERFEQAAKRRLSSAQGWTHFPPIAATSTTNARGLSNFMHLHGKPLDNHSIGNCEEPREDALPSKPVAPAAVMVVEDRPRRHQIAMPAIMASEQPATILVSPSFLTNRQLIRLIEGHLPGLNIIERSLTPVAAATVSSQAKSHGADADVTFSPGGGLIVTSLVKLRQQPLPGQRAFFGIRERITLVASRYERLVVLVGGNVGERASGFASTESSSPLIEGDASALSDIICFSTGLNTDVEVYYVAGGDVEMATWIAALISRCAAATTSRGQLLHEETLWEQFLCAAGLNAFAAQVVLDKLKRADSDVQVDGSYGPAALLSMTGAERVKQFGPLLGGGRVLQRLSSALDGGWHTEAPRRAKTDDVLSKKNCLRQPW